MAEDYAVAARPTAAHACAFGCIPAAAGGLIRPGGALGVRGIEAWEPRLWLQAKGEVRSGDGVLVLRRIRVRYHLRLRKEDRGTAEPVHRVHREACPVYGSIRAAIAVRTGLATNPRSRRGPTRHEGFPGPLVPA